MLQRSDFKSKTQQKQSWWFFRPIGFLVDRFPSGDLYFPATESLMDVLRWHPRWDNAASHVQLATLTSVALFWEDWIPSSDWQTLFTGVWSSLGVSDPTVLYYLILITLVNKWNPILYQFTRLCLWYLKENLGDCHKRQLAWVRMTPYCVYAWNTLLSLTV